MCCLKQFVANLGNSFLSVFISVTWFTWWLECQIDHSRRSKGILKIFVVNSLRKEFIQPLPEGFKTEWVCSWLSLQRAALWLHVLRWYIWQWIKFSCWVIFPPVVCSREASFAWFVTRSLVELLDLMSLVPVALARCSMGTGEMISGIGFKPKLVL